MTFSLTTIAAALIGALAFLPLRPAAAQGVPGGSYLSSCTDIRVQGESLTATCRTFDGRPLRTVLENVDRCVGDISNDNGVLQCRVSSEETYPGFRPPPPPAYAEHYPPPPYYGPRYGEPGYRRGWAEWCGEVHRRSRWLRARLHETVDPVERRHLFYRLHEMHEQRERCRAHGL
jgi:hypothetical protein